MFKKVLAVLLLSFALIGCGDDSPKIDLTTPETFTNSIKAASDKLSDKDKMAFSRAIIKVTAAAAMNPDNAGNEAKTTEEIKSKLHGKTAEEIINKFDK